jgi:stage II sporulation protein D
MRGMGAGHGLRRAALSVQPFHSDTGGVNVLRRPALLFVLLAAACTAPVRSPAPDPPLVPATIRVHTGGRVVRVALEDYVRTVILSEVTPSGADDRAAGKIFELQAIVSRTYALAGRHRRQGYDVCSTTHCQLYEPSRTGSARWAPAAREAVDRTKGVLVWYGHEPARVVYHADCGGRTSAARDVWSGDALPYLSSVADEGPARDAHMGWRLAPAPRELLRALNADPATRVGARLDRIDVLERDRAQRVRTVALRGPRAVTVRGEEFRRAVNRTFGPRALRSTRFDVARTADGFVFTGRGFGHGVGLCQAGAFARLAAGARPVDVLAHYFPGTSVR